MPKPRHLITEDDYSELLERARRAYARAEKRDPTGASWPIPSERSSLVEETGRGGLKVELADGGGTLLARFRVRSDGSLAATT